MSVVESSVVVALEQVISLWPRSTEGSRTSFTRFFTILRSGKPPSDRRSQTTESLISILRVGRRAVLELVDGFVSGEERSDEVYVITLDAFTSSSGWAR